MRIAIAVLVAILVLSVLGCTPKPSEHTTGTAPIPPAERDVSGREAIAKPDQDATQVGGEPIGEVLESSPDFGLYSDPGDLPHYDLVASLREDSRYLAYADMDGDGVREAITVGSFEKKAGGQRDATAQVHLGKWDDAEQRWTVWYQIPARGGESVYDEDSIGFAYDMDGDGAVEFGLQFYRHPEAAEDEDALVSLLYVYRMYESGPDVAVPDHMRDSVHGAVAVLLESDEVFVGDIFDDCPGDELVTASARAYRGEAEPYMWSMNVYGWIDGKLGNLYKYQTDNRYDTADAAYEAWAEDEGDYELTVDYTDDEE